MTEYSPLQARILEVLQSGPKTRGQLVLEIRAKRTTIYDNLKILEKAGKVKKYTINDGVAGGPFVAWRLSNLSELIRGEERDEDQ